MEDVSQKADTLNAGVVVRHFTLHEFDIVCSNLNDVTKVIFYDHFLMLDHGQVSCVDKSGIGFIGVNVKFGCSRFGDPYQDVMITNNFNPFDQDADLVLVF